MNENIKILGVGLMLLFSVSLYAENEIGNGGDSFDIKLQQAKQNAKNILEAINEAELESLNLSNQSREIFLAHFNDYKNVFSDNSGLEIRNTSEKPLYAFRFDRQQRVEALTFIDQRLIIVDKTLCNNYDINRLTALLLLEGGHMVGFGDEYVLQLAEISAAIMNLSVTEEQLSANILLSTANIYFKPILLAEIQLIPTDNLNDLTDGVELFFYEGASINGLLIVQFTDGTSHSEPIRIELSSWKAPTKTVGGASIDSVGITLPTNREITLKDILNNEFTKWNFFHGIGLALAGFTHYSAQNSEGVEITMMLTKGIIVNVGIDVVSHVKVYLRPRLRR